MFKSKPNLTHLRTFGCICFPLLKPYNAHKILPHTTSCLFLGYPIHTKGYICQDPLTFWIYVSRHVHFNENEFLYPQPLSTSPSTDSSSNSPPSHHISIPFITPQCPSSISQSSMPSNGSSHSFPNQSNSHPLSANLSVQSSSPHSTSFLAPLSNHSPSPQYDPSIVPLPQPTSSQLANSSSTSTIPTTVQSQASLTVNTHPMITRSKDGIFKAKALAAMTDATPHAFLSKPTVQCHTKSTKVNSIPKPDYTFTEPPSYKVAAQFP